MSEECMNNKQKIYSVTMLQCWFRWSSLRFLFNRELSQVRPHKGLGLWYLTPLSTIFQLYRGG